MRKTWIILSLVLTSCGEKRLPAPTAEQNEQLNEAEQMLNEEGAASGNAAPSNSD